MRRNTENIRIGLKTVYGVVFLLISAVTICGYIGIQLFFNPLANKPSSHQEVYDFKGIYIGEILPKGGMRHQSIDQVPKTAKTILITLEDATFYTHMGVSLRGVIRSIYQNILAGSNQYGGSTITMGLARNLLGINRERTYTSKIGEIFYAFFLELRYSKEEIITAYFDRVYFGRNTQGIGAASRKYYNKPLEELGDNEILGLITLMKNPGKYNPTTEPEAYNSRFERIKNRLRETGIIEQDDNTLQPNTLQWKDGYVGLPYVIDGLRKISLSSSPSTLDDKQATPYSEVIDSPVSVETNNRKEKIITTIDYGLTKKVETIADGVLFNLAKRNVQDYGVLIVDRKTQKVRVLIGGKNYHGDAGQVSSIFSPRQIGSTIKPFTYSLAIEKGIAHIWDTIQDLPVTFLTAEGNPYEPKNYSRTFQGKITVGEALAGSVNVPAILLTEKVSTPELLNFLQAVGITTLREGPDHYGLALGLGVGEVSMWELVQAYTIWSNSGWYCKLQLLEFDPPLYSENTFISQDTVGNQQNNSRSQCTQKLSPGTVEEIVFALSSQTMKAAEFPNGSTLDFGEGQVFVKTGTSRNFRDNYAIGFTNEYIIGVWTGNKDGENMRGVTGASGAGEIFAGIVKELGNREPIIEDKKQQELLSAFQSGKNTTKTFSTNSTPSLYEKFKITRPTTNTQISEVPGIPKERQGFTIEFWSETPLKSIEYLLDEKKLQSSYIQITELAPGTHTITVRGITPSGEVVESSTVFQKVPTPVSVLK